LRVAILVSLLLTPKYSWAVPGIQGPDPAFRDDDGTADPSVRKELSDFAAGHGSEQAALTALARSRLLVPVVAVLAEQIGEPGADHVGRPEPNPPEPDAPEPDAPEPDATEHGGSMFQGQKASDMAMPTLIGLDGRRAIPVFTCMESMRAWQADARPVPVPASRVWQAATAESCAVMIDVAGPVPIAIEGVRLDALARGESAPAPCSDADVHRVVSDVLAAQPAVAGFELRPGGAEHDLVIALKMSGEPAGRDITDLATGIGNAVMERLGGRLRRGIAIWLGGAGTAA
jgi:SseB protein N-terminal domain